MAIKCTGATTPVTRIIIKNYFEICILFLTTVHISKSNSVLLLGTKTASNTVYMPHLYT